MENLQKMDLTGVTGLQRYDRYVAIRSTQGGRVLYTIQVPLSDVPIILPVPDPERPTPGNRRVNAQHARKFGEYVRDKRDWVAPPLLARDEGRCVFKEQQTIAGDTALGILDVPWASGAARALKIIDGQHRILGIDLQIKEIEAGITRLEDDLLRAKDVAKKKHITEEIGAIRERHQQLQSEHFTLQIYVESEPQRFEQMFYDVADNALGINQAVKVRFDNRKVLNRTLYEVTKHALLKDRVDEEQDRIRLNNPNLLGAKHVIDLVRTVNVGITGRIGPKREEQLDESSLIEAANDFFDCLLNGFPDLENLVDGKLTAVDLRGKSLLGSVGMLRVLAGVFHQLRENDCTDDEIIGFFNRLAPHMGAPVAEDGLWRTTEARQEFPPRATGPAGQAQALKRLTDEMVRWYTDEPAGL